MAAPEKPRRDRFILRADDVEIVSGDASTLLPESILELGRERIAAGEDPAEVALDLAIQESVLLGDGD